MESWMHLFREQNDGDSRWWLLVLGLDEEYGKVIGHQEIFLASDQSESPENATGSM
jgi:hypothetical protein